GDTPGRGRGGAARLRRVGRGSEGACQPGPREPERPLPAREGRYPREPLLSGGRPRGAPPARAGFAGLPLRTGRGLARSSGGGDPRGGGAPAHSALRRDGGRGGELRLLRFTALDPLAGGLAG